MVTTLRSPPSDLDAVELRSLSLLERLAVAREARLIFGVQAARRVWVAAGLPEIERAANDRRNRESLEHFESFRKSCTVEDAASEVSARNLIEAYFNWCKASGFPTPARAAVGRLFAQCGLRRRKSGSTIYLGIRLAGDPSPRSMLQPSLLDEVDL